MLSALAILDLIARLNRRWAQRLGENLALHVGINTGTVVAGYLGSGLNGVYAVTGNAVNTAARLQHTARPGQILVGPDTYRLTQEAFVFQPLEPIAVRGKREPLAAFELLGTRQDGGRAPVASLTTRKPGRAAYRSGTAPVAC